MKRKTLILSLFVFTFLITSVVSVLAASLGDPFDGTGFQNANWKWQNEPANWDIGKTAEGWLHITAENNQNLWSADTSARLYQETTLDELDVGTHVMMEYEGTSSCVSGLVIKSPKDDNWTTLKFWGRAADTILQWQHKAEEVVNSVAGSNQPAGRVEVFIRIAKDGDEYTGYWKMAAGDEWTEITPHANKVLSPPLEVGIYAANCEGAGTMTAEYEYFNDLLNPFETAVAPKGKLAAYWGDIKSK
jgi:hypothetical protein